MPADSDDRTPAEWTVKFYWWGIPTLFRCEVEEDPREVEAMGVLQGMWGMNAIVGDIVCIMPTKDHPNKITAIDASVIMFEQICLVARALAEGGGAGASK